MMDIVGIDRREMIWKVGLNLDLVLDLCGIYMLMEIICWFLFLFSGEGKDVQSGRFYMFGITSRCDRLGIVTYRCTCR